MENFQIVFAKRMEDEDQGIKVKKVLDERTINDRAVETEKDVNHVIHHKVIHLIMVETGIDAKRVQVLVKERIRNQIDEE